MFRNCSEAQLGLITNSDQHTNSEIVPTSFVVGWEWFGTSQRRITATKLSRYVARGCAIFRWIFAETTGACVVCAMASRRSHFDRAD